jgi:broad-specificity NMP kinase
MAERDPSKYRLNTTPVVFKTLENAQNVEAISKIFANNKPNYKLKPNPYFVIVVGAPGVGKTTKTQQILKKMGMEYNDFYNISLDSLVERVEPYRKVTKRLYNTLKAKKERSEEHNMTEKNYALLSEIYLPTIMSKNINFSLSATEKAKINKIAAIGDATVEEPLKKEKVETGLKELNELRSEGLKYGVMNELNIIYDTTLVSKKDKVKEDIMPILEMNKNVKYKIIVILVTAEARNIQNRIKGRHKKMLEEKDPYIRAINPHLTDIFIKQNKEGFDNAKKYFTSDEYKSEIYKKDDFKFIEESNPPNNYNKNNNYRRTLKRLFGNTNNF